MSQRREPTRPNTNSDIRSRGHKSDVRKTANPSSERDDERKQTSERVAQSGHQAGDSINSEANTRTWDAKRHIERNFETAWNVILRDPGPRSQRFCARPESGPAPFLVTESIGRRIISDIGRMGQEVSAMLQSKGQHGGYSSEAERLTVAQDVVGSIPTSRPSSSMGL
jgi:hypothetical protein